MSSERPLSRAISSFALDLFKVLVDEDKASNVSFSPLSISSALAMVLLGARGDTASQMSQCLKIEDCKGVHSSFASLLQKLNDSRHRSEEPFNLSVANRLYGEQSFKFVKDFLKKTKKHYSAELETVDFVNKTEEARVHINTWVEEQTEGKIKDLLAKSVLNTWTRLVLVNAIYLKANWISPFCESDTRDAKFRLNKSDTKKVKMMHKYAKCQLRQIKEIDCQVIELPYRCGLSMIIFLPDDIKDSTTGLEKLEKQLTYENFVEWSRRDKMSQYMVDLCLPQFKMEGNYELNNVLKTMGMEDAFDEHKCDFSGMSPIKGLFLSNVVHKTFVYVDEKGTEAVAATAAIGFLGSMRFGPPIPQAQFIADHPFLFFIQHNETDSVLFTGRYCSPE